MSSAIRPFFMSCLLLVSVGVKGASLEELLSAQQRVFAVKNLPAEYQQRIIDGIGTVDPAKTEHLIVPILNSLSDNVTSILQSQSEKLGIFKKEFEEVQRAFSALYEFDTNADDYQMKVVLAFSGLEDFIGRFATEIKRHIEGAQKLAIQKKVIPAQMPAKDVSGAGPASGTMPGLAGASLSKKEIEDMVVNELARLTKEHFFENKDLIASTMLYKNDPEQLFWDYKCPNTIKQKRIEFIGQLVEAIMKKYPNKKELVYTSFGSGGFLQDYLAIHVLLKIGFSLKVNLIDLSYKEFELKWRVSLLASQLPKNCKVAKYSTVSGYIERVDPSYKSDVLVMVDVHFDKGSDIYRDFLRLINADSDGASPLVYEFNYNKTTEWLPLGDKEKAKKGDDGVVVRYYVRVNNETIPYAL